MNKDVLKLMMNPSGKGRLERLRDVVLSLVLVLIGFILLCIISGVCGFGWDMGGYLARWVINRVM